MRAWIRRHGKRLVIGIVAVIAVGLLLVIFRLLLGSWARSMAASDLAQVSGAQGAQVSPDKQLEAIDQARFRLLTLLGGVAVLGTLVVTMLTYRLSVMEHVTERYGKAVGLLGAEKAFERTGGVLELEQIMRSRHKFHAAGFDVLASFVRDYTRETRDRPSDTGKLRPDASVQAALTVLGRSRRDNSDELRFSDADLRGANLRNARFEEVRLRRAWLNKAKLEGARLERAELMGADLSSADLEGARLKGAHLERAILRSANLTGTDLRCAKLEGANLRGAEIAGAHLAGVTPTDLRLLGTIGRPHCLPTGSCPEGGTH